MTDAKQFIESLFGYSLRETPLRAIVSLDFFARIKIVGYRRSIQKGLLEPIPKWEKIARLCHSKDRRQRKRGWRLAYQYEPPCKNPWSATPADTFEHGGITFAPYQSQEN